MRRIRLLSWNPATFNKIINGKLFEKPLSSNGCESYARQHRFANTTHVLRFEDQESKKWHGFSSPRSSSRKMGTHYDQRYSYLIRVYSSIRWWVKCGSIYAMLRCSYSRIPFLVRKWEWFIFIWAMENLKSMNTLLNNAKHLDWVRDDWGVAQNNQSLIVIMLHDRCVSRLQIINEISRMKSQIEMSSIRFISTDWVKFP